MSLVDTVQALHPSIAPRSAASIAARDGAATLARPQVEVVPLGDLGRVALARARSAKLKYVASRQETPVEQVFGREEDPNSG